MVKRLMRALVLTVAVVVLASSTSFTTAHHASDLPHFTGGYFNNSSIGDSQLWVCYGWGPGDPITDNARAFNDYLNGSWRWAIGPINFQIAGNCVNAPWANIKVQQGWLGQCGAAPLGWTETKFGSYSQIRVELSHECVVAGQFDYDHRNGTVNWTWDANSVIGHEVGHALGLAHDPFDQQGAGNNLMSPGGPANCNFLRGMNSSLSYNDMDTVTERYPGLQPNPFYWVYTGSAPCWD